MRAHDASRLKRLMVETCRVENSLLKRWHSMAFLEMARHPDVCHRGTSASLQKRRLRSGSSGLGPLGCGGHMEMPRVISARNQQLWANLKRDQTENLGATCKKNKTKKARIELSPVLETRVLLLSWTSLLLCCGSWGYLTFFVLSLVCFILKTSFCRNAALIFFFS